MDKTRKFKVGDHIWYWHWLSIDEGDNYEGDIIEVLDNERFLVKSYGVKKIIWRRDIIDELCDD